MLFILFCVLFFGCTQVENKNNLNIVKEYNKELVSLDNLCSGEMECKEFCKENISKCEAYCRGKHIGLCRMIFPPNSDDIGPQENTGCTGTGIVNFTSSPMRIEDIETIQPIGLMIGGHVTPIDHGYYNARTWTPGSNREDTTEFVDIIAPAKGVVTRIQSMPKEYSSSSVGDYRIVIHHTCSFYTIYIHINQLSEKLQAIADTGEKITVEAGEIIGKAPGFDFSVHNEEITLPGFSVPETYIGEPWKIHTVDMFDYFISPIRKQLLDKNIRQKEPRGGKIDYDIGGKLVGNWFVENTGGYSGTKRGEHGYWWSHLAFAYDGLDPSLIIVSMGDYNGEAKQFAVKGNSPDPKDIGIENGIIKYELTSYNYLTESGAEWNRHKFAKIKKAYPYDQNIMGTVLVQVLDNRKIKFEVFPDKTANEVKEFTEKSKIYER